jgi:hypothetical protein
MVTVVFGARGNAVAALTGQGRGRPANYPQSWNSGRASADLARAYAAKGGASGPHTPPCRPGRAHGTRENKPRDHTRHPHPKTAKHQTAYRDLYKDAVDRKG